MTDMKSRNLECTDGVTDEPICIKNSDIYVFNDIRILIYNFPITLLNH